MNWLTIREIIKEINFCMLNTTNKKEQIDSRPMLTVFDDSEVDSLFFFCMTNSQKIIDLRNNNNLSLSFQDNAKGTYIHIVGNAEIIDDIPIMQSKWDKRLNKWWVDEAQTEGLSMIKMKMKSCRYWTEKENGVIA